jgi:AraC-like DNA-binding protein
MPTNVAYTKRFNAVLAYIDANLEGDLSVKALSHVANFSAFHFHRQFTTFVGVPVSRYVQLMRLRRAAHRLAAFADHSVLDAALGAGFESPEAFCRAFRRAGGMTPSAFRKEPNCMAFGDGGDQLGGARQGQRRRKAADYGADLPLQAKRLQRLGHRPLVVPPSRDQHVRAGRVAGRADRAPAQRVAHVDHPDEAVAEQRAQRVAARSAG